MLEDVPGLINPIIQSMIATNRAGQEVADRQQRAEALKTEAGYKQAELKHQDAQLAELQRSHKMEEEHRNRMLDEHDIPIMKALLSRYNIEDLANKTKLRGQGVDLNKVLPYAGGATDQNAGIPSQEEQQQKEIDLLKKRAGATTEGTMAAQQPFLDAAETRKEQQDQAKLVQEHKNKLEELVTSGQISGDNAVRAAKVHGDYELANSRINGQNHLRGIILGMGGDEAGANTANQLINGIFSGQTNYKDLPMKEKALVDRYTAGTGETLPTNGVAYKGALDRVKSMQELLGQARDLANNYSRDTKGGTTVSSFTHGLAAGVVPGTDLASKLDSFKAFGGKLVTELEGMKRSSDADILRQALGAFDPKAKKAQNLQKINDRAKAMQTVLSNDVAGLPKDRVAKTLGDMGITDFGAPETKYSQTATGPNEHKIGTNDGKTWFDVQTGNKIQ